MSPENHFPQPLPLPRLCVLGESAVVPTNWGKAFRQHAACHRQYMLPSCQGKQNKWAGRGSEVGAVGKDWQKTKDQAAHYIRLGSGDWRLSAWGFLKSLDHVQQGTGQDAGEIFKCC